MAALDATTKAMAAAIMQRSFITAPRRTILVELSSVVTVASRAGFVLQWTWQATHHFIGAASWYEDRLSGRF